MTVLVKCNLEGIFEKLNIFNWFLQWKRVFKNSWESNCFLKGTLALGRHSESECLEIFLLFYCHCHKQNMSPINNIKKKKTLSCLPFKKKTKQETIFSNPYIKVFQSAEFVCLNDFLKTWNYIKFWSLCKKSSVTSLGGGKCFSELLTYFLMTEIETPKPPKMNFFNLDTWDSESHLFQL